MKKVLKYDTIAVDFDGTIVENKFPHIGELVPIAKTVINGYMALGGHVIINTCRHGIDEELVQKFLEDNNIIYSSINQNLPHRIAMFNVDCRKIGADLYIDDRDVLFQGLLHLKYLPWAIVIGHYWLAVNSLIFQTVEVEDEGI